MMKKIIILILLILVQYSCQEENSVEYKIRGEDYKYWLFIRNEPEFPLSDWEDEEENNYMRFYYFDKNGKFHVFFKNKINTKFEKIDSRGDDYDLGDDWYLLNDSTLQIRAFAPRKIETLTDNMMIYYDSLHDRRTLLIAAPDSLIPKEFHTLQ